MEVSGETTFEADELFAEEADDGKDVPEPAAPGGGVAVADGDFLAVDAPVAAVAGAGDAASGDAEREGFEADGVFPEAEVEVVVAHHA